VVVNFKAAIFGHPEDVVRRIPFKDNRSFAVAQVLPFVRGVRGVSLREFYFGFGINQISGIIRILKWGGE